MHELRNISRLFRIPSSEEEEAKWRIHLPDDVVTSLLKGAKAQLKPVFEGHVDLIDEANVGLSPLNRHRLLLSEPKISWREVCEFVAEAYDAYDARLGRRVRSALADPGRLRVKKVAAGEAGGWFTAGTAESERRPGSIIYQCDGTINDILFMAHEVGHLLASDSALGRAAPSEHALMCYHLGEIQGYFGQLIAYQYLFNHSSEQIQRTARMHFFGDVARNLYKLPVCLAAQQFEQDITVEASHMCEEWLGGRWALYHELAHNSGALHEDPILRAALIRSLHGHILGSLLAVSTFCATENASRKLRNGLSKVLFDPDRNVTILTVLHVLGISTAEELESLARSGMNKFRSELANIDARGSLDRPVLQRSSTARAEGINPN